MQKFNKSNFLKYDLVNSTIAKKLYTTLLILILGLCPATAQQISVFDGPNGPVATELSYPHENFYYLDNGDMISAPKNGFVTTYNGPNGEYLGSRIDGPND